MSQGDQHFYCGFRFLSHEANSAFQALRAQYEVRLIETRHAVEQDGWVMTESGRMISHAAQIRLVDVLIEMVETLYETAAKAYFCAVGSSEYKERVDFVEQQLLGYCLERWAQLTRGLPLEPVGFEPVAGTVLGSNEKLLSDTLAAHLRSKALQLELQMWQAEASPKPVDLSTVKALPAATTAPATFRSVAGGVLADSIDRGTRLTIEIFPSTYFFIPEKLAWDVEDIVERHEGSIRQAVLEVLSGLRSSTHTQASSALIFDAVTEMGTELFNAALDRMAWMDDYNSPEAYDGVADALYRDGLDFVTKKYELVISEIPGLGSACEPALLDALRMDWLQIREEAKEEAHESSRKVREAQDLGADTAARLRADATGHANADDFAKPEEAGSEVVLDARDRRVRLTRMDGSVEWINPATYGVDPPGTIWTRDDEQRISACVTGGRAEVRSELERIFAGREWPAPAALVESFRRYAINVFDVYASAYQQAALSVDGYQEALDQRLLPMVLRDLFGREWDRSPGEKVVRILWQGGSDGKLEGKEVEVVAGNDPDPTCVYYKLLSNAIEHRYRFLEPPPPAPGKPPGMNLPDMNWSQYIGLNERHNLAMAIKPYLEDRMAHWQVVYTASASIDMGCGTRTAIVAESSKTEAPAISEAAIITITGHSAGEGQRSAVENTAALGVKSDTTNQEGTKQRPGKERKGDASLLAGKRAVIFRTAEQYLGITERQRQNLVKDQVLTVEGKGQNKKITTDSLRAYLPPENPN